MYAVSTMHCMTVSLALGGEGLGAGWGEQKARELFAEAGLVVQDVKQVEGDIVQQLLHLHQGLVPCSNETGFGMPTRAGRTENLLLKEKQNSDYWSRTEPGGGSGQRATPSRCPTVDRNRADSGAPRPMGGRTCDSSV